MEACISLPEPKRASKFDKIFYLPSWLCLLDGVCKNYQICQVTLPSVNNFLAAKQKIDGNTGGQSVLDVRYADGFAHRSICADSSQAVERNAGGVSRQLPRQVPVIAKGSTCSCRHWTHFWQPSRKLTVRARGKGLQLPPWRHCMA